MFELRARTPSMENRVFPSLFRQVWGRLLQGGFIIFFSVIAEICFEIVQLRFA